MSIPPSQPGPDDRLLRWADALLELPPDRRAGAALALCPDDPALLARLLEAVSDVALDQLERQLSTLGGAAAPDPDPAPEALSETIGPYRLMEKLGEGGFGVVYVARQDHPIRRHVALKVIKAGMDSRQVINRFEAERQALALMDHPNIAKILDAGTTPLGRPYFVMELVRGAPITQYCDDNRLSPTQRLELMIPVCQAVQHAHQKGVIHRDLKPANVLVTLVDGAPVPKIIDFGVAKAISTPLADRTVYTEFRRLIGTPAYMSPEQLELSAQDVDTRADVYALGVLLYELLSGALPFDADALLRRGLAEMQRVVRDSDPPRPSAKVSSLADSLRTTVAARRAIDPDRLEPALRGDLDWIVMRAIERDRRRRYDTAEAFAADLRRHLGGEAVLARPPSAAYLVRKFVGRHRAGVAAGAVVLSALLLGLAAALWGFASATRDRDRAAVALEAAEQQSDLRARAEAQALRREYAATLGLADDILHRGEAVEAAELLESTTRGLRGWEWRHLMAIAHGAGGPPTSEGLAALERADALMREFIPKRPLDALGGELISVLAGPDPEPVYFVQASRQLEIRSARLTINGIVPVPADRNLGRARMSADGRWIATAYSDGTIVVGRLPAIARGNLTLEDIRRYVGFRGLINQIAWTPDGGAIVARSEDGRVHQWPVGAQIGSVASPPAGVTLVTAAPAADGRVMYIGHWGLVRAVDAQTGMPLWATPFTHWYVQPLVVFNQGRSVLGFSAGTPEMTLLDAQTGRLEAIWSERPAADLPVEARRPIIRPGVAAAAALRNAHGQDRLVVTHAEGPLAEIDPSDWSVREYVPRGWPPGARVVGPAATSHDGARLALSVVVGSQGDRRPLVVLLEGSPLEVVGLCPLDGAEASALCWSPDAARLVVGDDRGAVIVFDSATRAPAWRRDSRFGSRQCGVAWIDDPAGDRVAATDGIGALRIFDSASGEPVLARRWTRGVMNGFTYVSADQALIGAAETSSLLRLETQAAPEVLAVRAGIHDAAEVLQPWSISRRTLGPTSALRDQALQTLTGLSDQRRELLRRFNRGAGDDLNRLNSDVIFGLLGDSSEGVHAIWLPITRMLVGVRPHSIAFQSNHAWACLQAGLLDESDAVLDHVEGLMAKRDVPLDGEFLLLRAALRWRQARHDEARALLARAEAFAADTSEEDRVLRLLLAKTKAEILGAPADQP